MRNELRTTFLQSKQHMEANDFEIYYYSDINTPSAGPHSHNYFEFYFFISGSTTIYIDKKPYVLQNGDFILIPPNVPHYAIIDNLDEYYQRFVFWLSNDYYDHLIQHSDIYGYAKKKATVEQQYHFHFDQITFNALQSKMFNLIQERLQNRYGKAEKINVLAFDLLLDLNRALYELNNPSQIREEDTLCQKLTSYINTHLTDVDLSLETIAKEFYLNKYHISHQFKNELGISVHQYIIKKKLELFKEAIINSDNLTQTCLECGFMDYSNFFRAFKKEYGISPMEYKKKLDEDKKKFAESDVPFVI